MSVDSVLGCPFNIASYALLLHIITNIVNNHPQRTHVKDYTPGRVIMILGDTHIYSDEKADHVVTVKEQLSRKDDTYPFPEIKLTKQIKYLSDINELTSDDFEVSNYICGSTLKATMIA